MDAATNKDFTIVSQPEIAITDPMVAADDKNENDILLEKTEDHTQQSDLIEETDNYPKQDANEEIQNSQDEVASVLVNEQQSDIINEETGNYPKESISEHIPNSSQCEVESVLINDTESVPIDTRTNELYVRLEQVSTEHESVVCIDAESNSTLNLNENVNEQESTTETESGQIERTVILETHPDSLANTQSKQEEENTEQTQSLESNIVQNPISEIDINIEVSQDNRQPLTDSNNINNEENQNNLQQISIDTGTANVAGDNITIDANLAVSETVNLHEKELAAEPEVLNKDDMQEENVRCEDQDQTNEIAEQDADQGNISQHRTGDESLQVNQLKEQTPILQQESEHNLIENEFINGSNQCRMEVNNKIGPNTLVEENKETNNIDEDSDYNNRNTSNAEQCGENVTSDQNTEPITEHIQVDEGERFRRHVLDADSIEQQISNIVQDDDDSDVRDAKTMSIAEAISRDFDETDSEDVDKPDNINSKSLQMADDNVMGVNINDQLQHGAVTVTDTSGQIYFVQSVEDLIVVENDDMSTTLDQPEPFEVTVVSEIEDSGQEPVSSKTKEKSSIPSHILGRNIDNPVIDTFRNGKVPPKPRLGVKIPYKNLTSQIVSKDEIAKEILERQKQKYKQTGQTTREMLFAKKLTQRLAKKIAPPPAVRTTAVLHSTEKDEPINNSDLLAILEGDKDTDSKKKVQDIKDACGSKSNVSGTDSKKIAKSEHTIKKEEIQVPSLSKAAEREIALKQLQELPVSLGKRRRNISGLPFKKSRDVKTEILMLGNESISEDTVSHTKHSQELKKKEITKSEEPIQKKTTEKELVSPELRPKIEEKKTPAVSPAKIEEKNKVESEVHAVIETKLDDKSIEESVAKKATKESVETNPPDNSIEIAVQKLTDGEAVLTDSDQVNTSSEKSVNSPKPSETNQPVDEKVNDNIKNPDSVSKSIATTKTTESTKKPEKINIQGKEEYVERKLSNPPVKTYTRKRKSTEEASVISNVPDKKPAVTQKDTNVPPNTYVTKSSRIIKKKVIWDPDEPSTARSLAGKSPKLESIKEKVMKPETSSKKLPVKPAPKDIYKSPSKSPDNSKTKKRLSEVDRLLMDEGAVNMLYSVKNIDDVTKKKKSGVISLDRAQRELINKTNELKKELKTNSDKISPKSLRKKESPLSSPSKKIIPASVSRKKSKDSNRSSVHSPPASPSMVYSNHAEASRIIRRHSSSSYSSLDGEFEGDRKTNTNTEATPTGADKTSKRRNAPSGIEGNKPKKVKKNVDKDTDVLEKGKVIQETKNVKLVQSDGKKGSKYEKYKTFSVKQTEHMVQIILLPSFNNEAYLTPEILTDLCNIMKELEEDNSCTVVVMSSSASAFCHGINYKTLLIDKEQSRKAFAKKLATCVTNFFRVLAKFPKLLVAGIHGDTVGLGVTILPLFDMVIASDTATFSIPNARLGCAAEGGSLLSLPHLMHNVLVSELLYASRKLIAAEALRLGMVTRVLWPDKFQQELITIVKNISNYSPQFMKLTKKQLRQHMTEHIEKALNDEVDTLIQHWISSECQKNFGVNG